MVSKREWLAERNLAKSSSRGRFSAAAHAALLEAEKNGVVFDSAKPAQQVTAPVDTSAG